MSRRGRSSSGTPRQRSSSAPATSAQLRDTQRLAMLGTLSAGIAHEIRNPLSALTMSLDTIDRAAGNAPQMREAIALARESVERINRIVSATLGVARVRQSLREAVDIPSLVAESIPFVRATLREKAITFNVAIEDESLPAVRGNRGHLQQALINLLVNAVESIASRGEVSVVIRRAVGAPRPALVLEVSDTGVGMTRAEQSKLFTPFFTRKPAGTGLGLTITRDIVHRHGGTIAIESSRRAGTTVTLMFPIAKK